MYKVKKCLCCFDLKYGFLTYGTIFLIFRVAAIMALWNSAHLQLQWSHNELYSMVTMSSIGYLAGTSFALFIALRGIIHERSILIYPYLVVCTMEVSAMIASNIWATFIISPWYLLYLVIGGGIETYIFICLLSLYREIREHEKNGRVAVAENIALKAYP